MNTLRLAFRSYQSVLHKYPLATQASQAGLLMGLGDVIAQSAIEKRKKIDWMRTARFASVGLVIAGPCLRTWYSFLERRVGSKGGAVVVKKVLLDQLVFAPVFLGTLLTTIHFVNGMTVKQVETKMKDDYPSILLTNYSVWPLVQLCNFYIVPLHYQVLVVQSVAVFWNTYLSWKSNRIVALVEHVETKNNLPV